MELHAITPHSSGRRLQGRTLYIVLGALMLSLLLEALDQTIVGTAMPRIIAQLHGLDRYIWVVTIYLLASTTVIPLAGRLSDQFGRKWFLVIGVALFLVGSALCGAARTIDQLIAFRALQGVGGGIGIALVFTVVGDIFPPAERPRWQGIVGGVYAFSSVIGPTLGGWLADHGPLLWPFVVVDESRWRWVFYINLPLGGIALLALLIYLPPGISERSSQYVGGAAVRRIDFAGSLLAFAATTCLFLGLTWGGDRTYPWSSPYVIGMLVGAAILYACLIAVERRAIEPILPLTLFQNRVFAADALLSLFQLMTLLGMAFYMPLFLQNVLNASAAQSGATMTPFSISIPVGTFIAGMTISFLKRYQVVALAGTAIMTAGIGMLTLMTPTTSLLFASIAATTAGLGMGMVASVVIVVAQNALPATQLGTGTAAVRYLGQIGGTIGVAVVGTVVNQAIAAGFPLATALRFGFIATLVFSGCAFLAALFVRDTAPIATHNRQQAHDLP